MGDEADVRLVHAHAERVGGGDGVDASRQKRVLHTDALLVRHSGVIAAGAKPVAGQDLGPQLDGLAGGGVDDARRPDLRDQPGERRRLLFPAAAGLDGKRQVRALEAGDEVERIAEAELDGDVGPYIGRGRGGESRRRYAQVGAEPREPPVVGPEIVPPLADAVRLVHYQPGGPHPARAARGSRALASRSGAT